MSILDYGGYFVLVAVLGAAWILWNDHTGGGGGE